MSAVGDALLGSISVSESLLVTSPLSQQRPTDKLRLQVSINFGSGEGEVYNCSDTDIDASGEGSLRISFIKLFTLAFNNNITVPDPCQVFSVFNSFHSLFSWSVSCLITTSYPSKYGALCNKATLKLISSKFSLYSRFDGPSWDSSITLLTNISSLATGGERLLGFHNRHLHVNGTGCWTAPLQSLMEAPAFLRCHVSSLPPIFPLKYKRISIKGKRIFPKWSKQWQGFLKCKLQLLAVWKVIQVMTLNLKHKLLVTVLFA